MNYYLMTELELKKEKNRLENILLSGEATVGQAESVLNIRGMLETIRKAREGINQFKLENKKMEEF